MTRMRSKSGKEHSEAANPTLTGRLTPGRGPGGSRPIGSPSLGRYTPGVVDETQRSGSLPWVVAILLLSLIGGFSLFSWLQDQSIAVE
jgi:hypothetical protein